jgi:hypothetical protein
MSKISAVRHASSRRDSRSHVVIRVMRRKANRRHMTGDRDGQAAGKANPARQSRGRDSRHAQAQIPRLEEIHANLGDRLQEAREQGWLGEVAAIETTLAAAQKLAAMRDLSTRRTRRTRRTSIHLGMPDVRPSAGRCSPDS